MTETVEQTKTATAPVPAPNEAELQELGFDRAATVLRAQREMARKLRIAFEHFRVVTPEHLERFNRELRGRTERRSSLSYSYTYDRLAFTPISFYGNCPPPEVLEKVRDAKKLGCFDSFEVATIESVKVIPDPIIFGVIQGCPNKYFVAQWDNDVKIEDILREDEG